MCNVRSDGVFIDFLAKLRGTSLPASAKSKKDAAAYGLQFNQKKQEGEKKGPYRRRLGTVKLTCAVTDV